MRVTIAELRATPETYDGKLVRVSGGWFQDTETSALIIHTLDEKDWIYIKSTGETCQTDSTYLEFEERRYQLAMKQIAGRTAEKLPSPSTWGIWTTADLVGFFDVAKAPKGVVVKAGWILYPPPGFGHLNVCPYQLRLVRLINYKFEE